MIDTRRDLELLLLGAMMGNMNVRVKTKAHSFQDGDIKACAADLLAVDNQANRDTPRILNQFLLQRGLQCKKNHVSELIKHIDKIGKLNTLQAAHKAISLSGSKDVDARLRELGEQIKVYLKED